MTPERAKELLPVIQAFAEGKEIQYKGAYEVQWKTFKREMQEGLHFLDNLDYRIKPEPKSPWSDSSQGIL